MSPRSGPAPADFDAALAHAREGQFAAAIAAALSLAPSRRASRSSRAPFVDALTSIARIALKQGAIAEANDALAHAVRLAPDFADLQFQHACLLNALQHRAEARHALERALRLNPGYTAARVELALLDARDGLLAESLDAFRKLGAELPAEDTRVFRQGIARLEEADWDEAEAFFKRALRIADPNIEATLRLARERLAAGDSERAADLVRGVVGRHEAYADAHHVLGVAELDCGRLDDAIGSLARALELNPEYHDARVSFARALEAAGDATQAGEQLALVLHADPEHAVARQLEESWARRRNGRRASEVDPRIS
ncbi:MAG: tetratricopeptide repeat protein [Candidatus Eisenbacteria bacterium]|uniref:Tetratricopeptide repeat protein n=1 Tax=Eiseniibacteriota bacterium TaxID=2212470 RepID=A0A849SLD2_UNCEI|nr:tetratricopeptide repeat protein [Candidatus Eisenbacteria bacterium]